MHSNSLLWHHHNILINYSLYQSYKIKSIRPDNRDSMISETVDIYHTIT